MAERQAGTDKRDDLPIKVKAQGRFGSIRGDGVVASNRYVGHLHLAMRITVVSVGATDVFRHAGLRSTRSMR